MKNVTAFSKSSLCFWMKMLVFVILTFATPALSIAAATLLPPTLVSSGTGTEPGQTVPTTTPPFQRQSVSGAIGWPITGTSYSLPGGYLVEGGQFQCVPPTLGLTIITHGWQPPWSNGALPGWVREMAQAITDRVGTAIPIYRIRYDKATDTVLLQDGATSIDITQNGGAIILLDWVGVADEIWEYPAQNVADRFYNYLFGQTHSGHLLVEIPIHLIGHSRGCCLNARLAYSLAVNGVLVEQVTTLDPHPVMPWDMPPGYDWIPKTYINILFADNYYQTSSTWPYPNGAEIDGSVKTNLTGILIDTDDANAHTDVHTYYHGTIDLNATRVDDVPPRTIQPSWYEILRLPKRQPRDQNGYYFSRYVQGLRDVDGLHTALGGKGHREPPDSLDRAYPNVGMLPLKTYTYKVGDTIHIPYYYQDDKTPLKISFYLDNDTNPYNGYLRVIRNPETKNQSTGILTDTFYWNTLTSDAGTYAYIQVKAEATDGTGWVHYDYLFTPISINAESTAPDLTALSVTAPTQTTTGETIPVAFTVKNLGNGATGNFGNRISLATSAYGTDIRLGDFSMTSFAPSESRTETRYITIPASTSPGRYWITVYTDGPAPGSVSESNEGNNIGSTAPYQINIVSPTYSITASAGAGGLVSPSGSFTKTAGADHTFTAIPSAGYSVGKWFVDGNVVQSGGIIYILSNIQANHSVQVTFENQPSIIRLEGDLNYGAVQVGGSVQRTMTIYNDGNSTLTVSSISYPTGFSGSWSGSIGAGSSRQVMVTFAPTEAKAYSGNVTVNSDKTSGINTRPVSGTGTITSTHIIRLVGNLSFGEVRVGGSANKSMTIYNDGNSTLTVSSIGYQEGFSGDWHGTIAAGSSKQVTVTFTPTTTKAYSGDVIVYSDAISGANTLPASGTGIIAQTRDIRLTGDLNFGEVQVGHSASKTMTIFNNGNLTLTVNSISYPPGFSGAWSGTVEGGTGHSVTVAFSPTEEKTYSGNVVVDSDATNGTNGTNTLPVSGTGTIKSIFTLTVASSSPDSGVTITVSPNDNNDQGSGTTQSTRTYNTDTTVMLTAPPTAGGKDFQKWQRNGVDWTNSQTAYVTMDADYIMTAVYPTPVYTIGVGSQPHGVGVNPQTNRIYVANKASNYVSVIDGTNDQVVAKVEVGDEPFDVGVNPTTNRIYVSNTVGNSVSVIDGMSNQVVAKVWNVHYPFGIGVNPTTNRIYVANLVSSTVTVINGENNTVVTTVGVGIAPVGVAVNPQTNRIYVANANGGTVSVINGASNQVVTTVTAGSEPSFVGVNSQTNRIYVSDPKNDTVIVINGETNKVVATVGVGNQPLGIGVNPQTNRIYVANSEYSSSSVSVIDGAINQVLVTVGVQDSTTPRGVGVNPKTNRVYVSNQGGNMVSVIDWQLPPPEVSAFQINDGASEAASRTVTLNNTTTGNPTHYMASESASFTGAIWQTYAAAPSFPLSAGDGVKTVYFKVKDANGESAVVKDSIILKELPAVSTFQINNGASDTSIRTVTLNNTTTSSPTHYMASESPGFADALWLTYTASPSFTLSTGDGVKTVYFKVKNANDESLVVNDSIALKELPVVSTFQINNGTAETTSRTVTLNNTATGSPTHYMASEFSNFADATWQPYAAAPFFTLSAGDGVKTVYFKVKNGNGETAMVNDSIAFKELPVVVVFLINNGAADTASPVVMLNSTAAGSPTHYMASESLNFTNAAWQPYAAAPFFTLSAGDGVKTVYFKVKNGNGESAVANDDITFKEIPVVSTFQINNGAAEATSRTVTLNNTATGSPTQYMASESPTFKRATWKVYTGAPKFKLSASKGVKTVYFKVKNIKGESPVINDTITIKKALAATVADAGIDQLARKGSVITLDGSKSFSSEENVPLAYQWSFISLPSGMGSLLSDSQSVNPTFTLKRQGRCEIQLVVKDFFGIASEPDTVVVSTQDTTPVAHAGDDQSIREAGTRVMLNGAQSYDPDGDVLAYQWAFISRPAESVASLENADTVRPTFVADAPGDYVIQLTVTDSHTQSASDTVTVSFGNVRPVANAGKSLAVKVGDTVTLAGEGTDANGDALNYRWMVSSLPGGSLSEIADSSARVTSFTPDCAGVYVAQLVVSDGGLDSEPCAIQIQAFTTQTKTITALQGLETEIAALDSNAFKNDDMQNVLLNKLNAVIANVEAGKHADAANQLRNDILPKMGDAENAEGDSVAWIIDRSSPRVWYQEAQDVVRVLEMAR